MNRSQRIAILVAGLVAVVVAFVVLSPGDDSGDGAPAGTTGAATTGATTETATTAPAPPPRPSPTQVPLLTKGKVHEIKVSKGEIVRFRVQSSVPEEVHVHVYDVTSPVAPGGITRLAFKADKEGIFEIELHGSHTQIGKLVVQP